MKGIQGYDSHAYIFLGSKDNSSGGVAVAVNFGDKRGYDRELVFSSIGIH